jgi:transposase
MLQSRRRTTASASRSSNTPWVVERSFAWAGRFRRLARDYERLDTTLKGFHYLSFACLMLTRMFQLLNQTS